MSDVEIAQRSAQGSLVLFLGNFATTAVTAVAGIIIARLLGPDEYGVYSLVLVVPTLFQLIIGFGMNSAIIRFSAYHLSKGEAEIAKRIVSNTIAFQAFLGVILAILSYSLSKPIAAIVFGRPELEPLIRAVSILIVAQGLTQAVVSAFIGWRFMVFATLSSLVQAISKVFISVILISVGYSVLGALLGHASSYVLAGMFGVALLYFAQLRPMKGFLSNFWSDIRETFLYSVPVSIGNVALTLASQYILILLSVITTIGNIGYYVAASNVTIAISLVSSAFEQSLFPAFATLHGAERETGLGFRYAVKYSAYLLFPVIIFVISSADLLLQLIYGSTYASAAGYLRLIAIASMPAVIGLTVGPPFFNGLKRTKLSMTTSLAGAAALALSAALLGRLFGVYGVVTAVIVSHIAMASTASLLAARYLDARMDIWSAAGIVAAAAVSYFVSILIPSTNIIPLDIAVKAAAITAVYLTMIPIFRGIDSDDLGRLLIAAEGLKGIRRLLKPVLEYERYLINHLSLNH